MRTGVQIVQKRLPAPPLFWRMDMTAFAGVMLALVWLFVGPLLIVVDSHRPSVDLPHLGNATDLRDANREDAMFVAVERDGSIYFGRTRVHSSDLRRLIRDSLNRGSKPTVYFRVDARARSGVFFEAWEEVRSAGIERVAIVAYKRPPESSPVF